jgi:23S rRNA pseudouridine1911/1915/1917 synthase
MTGMDERLLRFEFSGVKGERLDKFLVTRIPEFSRSRIQGLIRDGFIQINQIAAKKAGQELEPGQVIDVRVPPSVPTGLIPEAIPLEVVFENNDLLVINKPAGMVVHPAAGHATGTLVQAALAHAPEMEGIGGELRPGVVHRLDKETSGLILMAKNDRTHRWLQEQFRLPLRRWQAQKRQSRPPSAGSTEETPLQSLGDGRIPKQGESEQESDLAFCQSRFRQV